MGSKRDSMRARKAEKKRKARDAIRARRGSRAGRQAASGSLQAAQDWPIGDCYASQTWDVRGSKVTAAFSRQHDDGRVAAAFFDIDLADKGLTAATARADLSEGLFTGELARRSDDDHAIVATSPALVVQLVGEAVTFASAGGHPLPPGLDKAMLLLHGVAPDTATIPFGPEPEAPPKPEAKGWLASLLGR